MFYYLRRHNVGSGERGHGPTRDGTADDDPNQSQEPEGHTHDLDSGRPHSATGRQEETQVNISQATHFFYFLFRFYSSFFIDLHPSNRLYQFIIKELEK